MEGMKGAASARNPGKHSFLLPPKSPLPCAAASTHREYVSFESNGAPKLREGHRHHHRTSSESFLIEEQPLWLDDLLNEPETPARRGAHRRSSSDSFAFLDGACEYSSSMDKLVQGECRQRTISTIPSWGLQEIEKLKDFQDNYSDANSFGRPQNRVWDSAFNMEKYPNSIPAAKDKCVHPGSFKEPPATLPCSLEKQEDGSPTGSKGSSENKETFQVKNTPSETDTKRVKQQFAQRSRVRKLQYIAELERTVQALQAEGLEVSAEVDFLDKQNLILNLENEALKQRLDSVAQEQLIKRVQQEMLEQEIARLRLSFQQQQQPTPSQTPPPHARNKSRDLDSQFVNLSLKHKETNSGRDSITSLHI
ncbi:Uncharacterized protein AXF42_Ash014647 [Apostasia shenzhenica]|uniref:BZIP domain-containing protein n=1 Tax=Apostasia shenzhenica TaxID=1088818 RepID=A0A2I0AKD3_9ASPA|nr:Uncharacterized protein AXF42_Ash014647 [Apostasia shenzhenica]